MHIEHILFESVPLFLRQYYFQQNLDRDSKGLGLGSRFDQQELLILQRYHIDSNSNDFFHQSVCLIALLGFFQPLKYFLLKLELIFRLNSRYFGNLYPSEWILNPDSSFVEL